MRNVFRNKATIYRYDIWNNDKAENQVMKRNGIFSVKYNYLIKFEICRISVKR